MDIVGPIFELALKGVELVIAHKKWRDSSPQDLRDIAQIFADISELLWLVRLLRLQARSVHDFDQSLLARAIKAERRGCAALIEADATIIQQLKNRPRGRDKYWAFSRPLRAVLNGSDGEASRPRD